MSRSGVGASVASQPKVGLIPKTPQKDDGMRIEPAPSDPSCSTPMFRAAATPAPPEEPPEARSVPQGLTVLPKAGPWVTPFQPNSGDVVVPRMTAPAARRRRITRISSVAGASPVSFEPRRHGMPLTAVSSLIVVGTPSIGPRASPFAQRASEARAASSAGSGATYAKAFTCGLNRSMRASAACAASTGETRPDANSAPSSTASISPRSVRVVRIWSIGLTRRSCRGHGRRRRTSRRSAPP